MTKGGEEEEEDESSDEEGEVEDGCKKGRELQAPANKAVEKGSRQGTSVPGPQLQ